jgi:phospholipase/carboxylesterase
MNRLQLLGKEVTSSPSSSIQIELARLSSGTLSSGTQRGVPHSLFAPMHYEPNYAYPLLIWLHGSGDDERQLQRIMPLVSMRNYVAVGPRGNAEGAERCAGFSWNHSPTSLATAEQHVFDALEAASTRFHIASHRVFLSGFEDGGTTAMRIALRYPDQFAGALTIGGGFPADRTPLSRLNDARRVPLFIAQGRDSQIYPVDRLCNDLRLFHTAGMSVTVRHYPCGDDLTSQMLHDMDVWMMEIVTGIPSGPQHPPVTPSESN